MKTERVRTATCFELKRVLKNETDPLERRRLKKRIWCKEHREQVNERSARYRELHPLTSKQRKKIYKRYMDRRFSGQGRRYAMR